MVLMIMLLAWAFLSVYQAPILGDAVETGHLLLGFSLPWKIASRRERRYVAGPRTLQETKSLPGTDAVNHPRIGKLEERKAGGWGLTLSLPAFQPFYERWTDEGRERPDTRGEDRRAGRFRVVMSRVIADGPGRHGVQPPSDAQVAAVEYLRDNQEQVAEVVKRALVEEAPRVFHWDCLTGLLADEMREKLAFPDGMMQVVELQTVVIGGRDDGGRAKIGFSFHSQI
ncbi:hypothetical protein, partial [Aquisphaera insulae]|uniref:hypothetical protein n=1 Tax=Aquisphaera insulae TaxID=2712864 RepID=UPI0013EA5C11